jgi:hypothetical protein
MDITVRSEGPWLPEDRSWLASAHGTTATRTITLDVSSFTANVHYPNGFIPSGTILSELTSGLFGPYAGRTAEAQTVTITGTPTGGTFTLTYEGATTGGIAYNATATAVRQALEALPGLSPGDVTVTGGPGPGTPYVVTFNGGGGDVAQMTASATSLTGGTSPAVGVSTTTAGASTGSGGTQTPAGHLFNSMPIRSGQTANVGAPLLEHGFVRISRLPANSGYDPYVSRALSGRITYRP